MAGDDHVDILKQGVDAWNKWRKDNPNILPNLQNADLQEFDLTNCNLERVSLSQANMRDAVLRDADLTGATDLVPGQLAGADLSRAKLPENMPNFEAIVNVEEASKNARKMFFLLLLICAYTILTISTTTDTKLITNSASSPLPIIQTNIPLLHVYVAAPFILLSLYIYFHLYLQRIWEELSTLPAYFPDGSPLDMKIYPWLLNGIVRVHYKHLNNIKPYLSNLRRLIPIFLAWGVTPLTLGLLWWRYLDRHNWFITITHIVLLIISIWFWIIFKRILKITLLREERKIFSIKEIILKTLEISLLALVLLLVSFTAIEGYSDILQINQKRQTSKSKVSYVKNWISQFFSAIDRDPVANLESQDISVKPANWKENEISQVNGVNLKKRNLKFAKASGAFFVKANLVLAHLEGADLSKADLRHANMEKAHLNQASLRNSKLDKVNLDYAILYQSVLNGAKMQQSSLVGSKLIQAHLKKVDLSDAILYYADFQRAKLNEAILSGAKFNNASLVDADLKGATIERAVGLTPEQVKSAKNWKLAYYDKSLRNELKLEDNHNEQVRNQLSNFLSLIPNK